MKHWLGVALLVAVVWALLFGVLRMTDPYKAARTALLITGVIVGGLLMVGVGLTLIFGAP